MLAFDRQCQALGLPVPVAEYKFHPTRRWRMDFAWVDRKLALEIQGGAFVGGRHSRGMGQVKDMEKFSEAAILGWRVLHCTPRDVKTGAVLEMVRRALEPG
jgi:very-short-patch-repair endonuclease